MNYRKKKIMVSLKNGCAVLSAMLFFLLFNINELQAADYLEILGYDRENFPDINISFIYNNDSSGIDINSLTLLENNIPVNDFNLNCTDDSPEASMSLILSFDKYKSGAGDSSLTIARQIARSIIDNIQAENVEFAVTAWDRHSYLFSDFTADRQYVQNRIDLIGPADYSNPLNAFNQAPGGIFDITGDAAFKPVIVLFTQGIYSVADSNIVNKLNAKVIIVSSSGYIEGSYRRLANESGGIYLSDVRYENRNLIAKILSDFINGKGICNCSFRPEDICNVENKIELSLNGQKSLSDSVIIQIIPEIGNSLAISPEILHFNPILPGAEQALSIELTALDDVYIQSLSLSNEIFEIIEGDIPTAGLQLNGTDSREIKIKFVPEDSAQVFATLEIKTDDCQDYLVYISGGFPNKAPRVTSLNVDWPNGGEALYIGENSKLQWSGVTPDDIIQLDYSTNNGLDWNILAQDISGPGYQWQVPDLHSDLCLIRLRQLWPRSIKGEMALKHNSTVNSVNFNQFGDLLVTASKDNCVHLWNAYTGEEMQCLKGHEDNVLWAEFNPLSNLIVSASEDETAIVWNRESGEQLFTLEGHSDYVTSACFSPDGSKILTSGKDGLIIIWNAETGDNIKEIDCGQDRVYHAKFSPDGKYIVSAGSNGILKLWDAGTYSQIKSFDTEIQMLVYAGFDPESKYIVTTSWYNKGLVFDIESRDTLYTFTHSDEQSGTRAINAANFFLKDTILYLISAGIDNIRIWDGETGKFLESFDPHESNVMYAAANFDASRIVSASWDSTAKIRNWGNEQLTLQSDSSDSTFSIRDFDPEINDLSMGKVFLGEMKDSLVESFIINSTKFSFTIDSLIIEDQINSPFKLRDTQFQYIVRPESEMPVHLLYNPKNPGIHSSELKIFAHNQVLSCNISAECIEEYLSLSSRIIDFSCVVPGEFKDTLMELGVSNTGPDKVSIYSIRDTFPDKQAFAVLENSQGMELEPGESKKLMFRFFPAEYIRYNSNIILENNGNRPTKKLLLFGKGCEEIIDSAQVSIPETIYVNTGETIDIPVLIKWLGEEPNLYGIEGIYFDVSFNATLLEPLDEFISSYISNGQRYVSLYLPISADTDSSLYTLKFKTALGNDTICYLNIENIVPGSPGKVVLNSNNSVIKFMNICKEGDLRLIETEGVFSFNEISPNPAGDNALLEFSLIEEGRHSLKIVNGSGNVVMNIFDQYMRPGHYKYNISYRDMSNGIYYYILNSPTGVMKRKLVLIK